MTTETTAPRAPTMSIVPTRPGWWLRGGIGGPRPVLVYDGFDGFDGLRWEDAARTERHRVEDDGLWFGPCVAPAGGAA